MTLQLPHALNFVQVDDETVILRVGQLNALPTEDRLVRRTIKVLHPVGMLLTQLAIQLLLRLLLKIESSLRQYWVLLDNLIQDVDVEGEALGRLQILDQLAADWAADAVLVVQLHDASSAESVPTMDKDPGDALANVVLERAELANVEATRLIVEIHDAGWLRLHCGVHLSLN